MIKVNSVIRSLIIFMLTVPLLVGCAGNSIYSNSQDEPVLEQAKKAYLSGQYKQAVNYLQPLADKGNSQAQYTLGYMYYYGQGVSKNFQKAILLISQAAAANHPKAIEALKRISGKESTPKAIDLTNRGLAKSGVIAVPPQASTSTPPVRTPATVMPAENRKTSPVVARPAENKIVARTLPKSSSQADNKDTTFPPAYVITMAKKNTETIPDEDNQKTQSGSSLKKKDIATSTGKTEKQSETSVLSKIKDGSFTIQVTSGQNPEHVKSFIRQHKLENAIVVHQIIKGKEWHSVIWGEYKNWADANDALKSLQKKGFKDAWILRVKDIKRRMIRK